MKAEMTPDGKTIVVTIPMRLKWRGGRRIIIAPDGIEMPPPGPKDEAMAKLVAKAHHWLFLLESGKFSSIAQLAQHEKLDSSYVSKVLRLTLLAPDIVEAIIDDRQTDVMTWREMSKPFPSDWTEQRKLWGVAT